MLLRASALLIAVTGVIAAPSAQGRPKADLTPLVESAAHAGGKVRVALQVSLPEGLHVQSNLPRDPMLIPTVLTVDAPAGVKVTQLVYPPSSDFVQAGQKAPLAVFENRFAIGLELSLDAGVATGPLKVPARLRYQACDASTCFIPTREALEWAVPVVPSGAAMPAAHAEVFSAIRFQRP